MAIKFVDKLIYVDKRLDASIGLPAVGEVCALMLTRFTNSTVHKNVTMPDPRLRALLRLRPNATYMQSDRFLWQIRRY